MLVLQSVNARHLTPNQHLSFEYSLPKIKGNYKGADTAPASLSVLPEDLAPVIDLISSSDLFSGVVEQLLRLADQV